MSYLDKRNNKIKKFKKVSLVSFLICILSLNIVNEKLIRNNAKNYQYSDTLDSLYVQELNDKEIDTDACYYIGGLSCSLFLSLILGILYYLLLYSKLNKESVKINIIEYFTNQFNIINEDVKVDEELRIKFLSIVERSNILNVNSKDEDEFLKECDKIVREYDKVKNEFYRKALVKDEKYI